MLQYSALHSNTEQDTELNSGRCTVSLAAHPHCTLIQNKRLNSIQRDALYLLQYSALHSNTEQDTELNSGRRTVSLAALYTALEYRIRCWTQFRKIHCTNPQHSALHSILHWNTEQDTELNSGRYTVPIHSILHCAPIQNKMLNSIQEDTLYQSTALRPTLQYGTGCWTQFWNIYCTNPQHSALHSNTE